MSRWRHDPVLLHVGAGEAGLAAALAAVPPGRVAVTVADSWVRYFLLAPPMGVASLRDCRLLLDARFEALYGLPPHEWVVQADWQAGRPMLACALPRALLQALGEIRPASVQPHLLALWNRHCTRLPATGALCSSGDGMASLLYWENGFTRLVRQQRQHCQQRDADALLALELARLEADVPAARFWHGDGAPAGWSRLESA